MYVYRQVCQIYSGVVCVNQICATKLVHSAHYLLFFQCHCVRPTEVLVGHDWTLTAWYIIEMLNAWAACVLTRHHVRLTLEMTGHVTFRP